MSGFSEHILLGWLCFTRYNLANLDEGGGTGLLYLPSEIKAAIAERGWATFEDQDGDEGDIFVVTEAGHTASDLAAPEWGIDPLPVL